jgi:hypothetical protein
MIGIFLVDTSTSGIHQLVLLRIAERTAHLHGPNGPHLQHRDGPECDERDERDATNVLETPEGIVIVAKSAVVARVQIAMIFVFGFGNSAGGTPNQAMYPQHVVKQP